MILWYICPSQRDGNTGFHLLPNLQKVRSHPDAVHKAQRVPPRDNTSIRFFVCHNHFLGLSCSSPQRAQVLYIFTLETFNTGLMISVMYEPLITRSG